MKQHGLLFLFFFLSSIAMTQTVECGTISQIETDFDATDFKAFKAQWKKQTTKSPKYEFPIQFHIVRNDQGHTNIDINAIWQELNLSNSYYTGYGIEFVHCGDVRYIDHSDYLIFSSETDGKEVVYCNVPDALNIYITHEVFIGNSLYCGYANFPWQQNPMVVIGYKCNADGYLLAHELGHALGLYHTHETYFGAELADGSNCDESGDFLCDTPADPGLNHHNVTQFCIYTGAETDSLEQAYTPNTRLIMSYSRANCTRRFTEEQSLRMYYSIENYYEDYSCEKIIAKTPNNSALWSVYPNPASDFIRVHNRECAEFALTLFDTTGKKILYQEKNNYIKLEGIETGVYLLHLQDLRSDWNTSQLVLVQK